MRDPQFKEYKQFNLDIGHTGEALNGDGKMWASTTRGFRFGLKLLGPITAYSDQNEAHLLTFWFPCPPMNIGFGPHHRRGLLFSTPLDLINRNYNIILSQNNNNNSNNNNSNKNNIGQCTHSLPAVHQYGQVYKKYVIKISIHFFHLILIIVSILI